MLKLNFMKKIFMIVAAASIFAACKNKVNSNLQADKNMVMVDTTGLYKSNASTDVGNENTPVNAHRSNTNNAGSNTAHRSAGNTSTNTNNNGTGAGSGGTTNSGGSTNSGGTAGNANSETAAAKDKRISDAAKGAAIGAGTGAVVGVIVSKDNAKGAIIGGIIGAGAGYAIGRSRDKKSGRVDRQRVRRHARRVQRVN